MRLTMLGGLALESATFNRPKPLLLLAYLAVEGSKDKRHLYELFWPEAADQATSLRMALSQLRKVDTDLFKSDERTVSTSLETDLAALQSAITERNAEKLLGLYKGEFLQGFSLPDWSAELEEWVYSTRDFIAARVRAAFLQIAEAEATRGKFLEAVQWAGKSYGLSKDNQEPEDLERLYPLLVAGDSALSSEVKKQAKEYGLELTLSREEAKARYFVAVPEGNSEVRSIPNNLPRAKTSFIGRDPELIEIGQMLHQSDVRLITLLGPGGMGKTRLGLQLAHGQLQEHQFADGVYFVALDVLDDPAQIPLVIAQTLGLNLQSKDDPFTVVKGAISNKHMLLVLDNFEQLMGGVLLVSDLLESCPNLTLLVTSRERLNLEEEFVFYLQGLPLPEQDNTDLSKIEYNDAVKLFVQRAKRARLDFQLSGENFPAVLKLCKLVEGSPLGIELAAVWLRSLTPADLLSEISKNIDSLETPSRNIVERHQSLRAVFEHSWKLLNPKEQTALARLTVFVGGFSREAAARVTDATIPILTSLVDKSLLKVTVDGRYERHALLYQFAHEKLLAQPALHQEMQQKHLAFFVTLAEEIAPKLGGSEQALWLEHLQSDLDNFRAVSAFAMKEKQTEAGLRLTLALTEFWMLRNYREGYQQTAEVLSLPTTDADVVLRIKTLISAGGLAASIERYAEAKTHYEEALSLAQQQNDNNGIAGAFLGLGVLARFQGDFSASQGFLEQSLALYRTLDDKRSLARALTCLGIVFLYQDKPLEAKPFYEEALRIYRALGDPRLSSLALSNLGALSEQLGEFATAKEYYQQSLVLAKTVNDKSSEATALHNLAGCLRKLQEDSDIARTYYVSSFELFLELDTKYDALWCLANIAIFASETHQHALALQFAGVVEAQTRVLGISFPEYHLASIHTAIETSTEVVGESEAKTLRNEGRKMSLAETLALTKAQPNTIKDEVLARAKG